MATLAPLMPGLPVDPVQEHVRREGLKPRTWQQVHGRRARVRSRGVLRQTPILTPLSLQDGDVVFMDFLLRWHALVEREGEHARLWGQAGLSPTTFAMTFRPLPLLLLHDEARGLMMVLWRDDDLPECRARLHFWIHPAYRHPRVSLILGQHLIDYCFTELRFKLLEGRTPVSNHAALRYIRRLGFQPVCTLPYGEWEWAADETKTLIPVVQSQLTIDMWKERIWDK